jgi:hypothetical protein
MLPISRIKPICRLAIFLLLLSLFWPLKALASDSYWIGWYSGINSPYLAEEGAAGVNLVMPYALASDNLMSFLNEAQSNNIKVLLQVVPQGSLANFVNTYKNHPALFGWYLADEPNLRGVSPASLISDYQSIKQADPNHPVAIAFCCRWISIDPYYDALDIIMYDHYPFTPGTPEFWDIESVTSVINDFVNIAKNRGKKFIIILQGHSWPGSGDYSGLRDPYPSELDYTLYTSLIRDTDGTLFWDDFHSSQVDYINSKIKEATSLGGAIRNGKFNDPAVSRSNIAINYRYGSDGSFYYLIAVNESSSSVSSTFTLPANISVSQLEVLNEGRSISVSNRSFTDSFTKYQTHIYKFSSTNISTPDFNQDGKVDNTDLAFLLSKWGTSGADLSQDKTTNETDLTLLLANWQEMPPEIPTETPPATGCADLGGVCCAGDYSYCVPPRLIYPYNEDGTVNTSGGCNPERVFPLRWCCSNCTQ